MTKNFKYNRQVYYNFKYIRHIYYGVIVGDIDIILIRLTTMFYF